MQQHGVVLDFSADPVGIHFPSSTTSVSNRHKNPLVFATISSDSQDADCQMAWTWETSAQFPASLMMKP